MALTEIDIGNLPSLANGHAVILMSKWYSSCVQSMYRHCSSQLKAHGFDRIDEYVLPGTLEMPFACKRVIDTDGSVQVVICLAVVVEGDTDHYAVIRESTTRGLLQISLESNVPIVNEILFVHDLVDAELRSADNSTNKGIEAAVAAIEIVHFNQSLQR